ncbi:MAG: hypothetical protein H0X40_07420 [Chthoniobacterales bacterium]|nr:hypothetical protein [Chthoniobacterales bacterium]
MKRSSSARGVDAHTLVEMLIGVTVLVIVGAIAYSLMISSASLLAKDISLNSSNTTARSALDRVYNEVTQGNALVTTDTLYPKPPCILVKADGTVATSPGPAAGIVLDRYIGGPYIVGNPGGGLSATATTFKLFYSTDPLANPPAPVRNDVVIMDGATRALVSSSSTPSSALSAPTPTPVPTPGMMVTVTLQSTLGSYTQPPVSFGSAIPWANSTQETAYLLHREAFVVVPPASVITVNGISPQAELRMYPDAENLSSIISDSTKYVVLTGDIGTKTISGVPEQLPFSYVVQNGITFLNIALRVEDHQYNKRLANQQANEFNTFLRVDTMLRPRINP